MWVRHLPVLRCPGCGGRLQTPCTDEWIEDGWLHCKACQASFPVERGIPRLLAPADPGGVAADARTKAAFGFEWLTFPVTTVEEDRFTFFALTGVEPGFYHRTSYENPFAHRPSATDLAATATAFFHGKTVLDAGCGMGKYVAVVAAAGAALVVGVDASAAVERAGALTRALPNVLIVQADIFRLPLAAELDFAYSLGVLHHTPAPFEAFRSVAGRVRPGGGMAVWLYPRGTTRLARAVDFWFDRVARPLLSRLPHRVLKLLCGALGYLTVAKTDLARHGRLGRGLSRLLGLVAVGQHWDPKIAAFLNFDWYSPPFRSRHTAAELRGWFETAGFAAPAALPEPVSAIGFKR